MQDIKNKLVSTGIFISAIVLSGCVHTTDATANYAQHEPQQTIYPASDYQVKINKDTPSAMTPRSVDLAMSSSSQYYPTATEHSEIADNNVTTENVEEKAQEHPKITQQSYEQWRETERPAASIEPIHHEIIWNEMRNQFHIAEAHLGEYDNHINYFKKRPDFMLRVTKRAEPYLYYIFSEVKKRKMPYEIALLPIIESSFRPIARSHQAAGGLWQFIPSTAHLFGLDQNWWFDGRQDTIQSTQAALNYLQKLYFQNGNDWLLALASYNGGIGNVQKAKKRYRKRHKNPKDAPDFWDLQPYLLKETRHYVPQLLAVSHIINQPDAFNVEIAEIKNKPFFKEVAVDQQISLRKIANLTDISESELRLLNAGYLRPTTPPKGPHNIILPIDKAEILEDALTTNSALFDIQWIKHTIKPGESISVIASKYNASSKAIRNINGMRNNQIRAGKTLLIPIPASFQNQLETVTTHSRYKGPKKIHVVKSGDSIWSIARYYNVDTRTLCMWNRIGIRQPLRIGQRLEIRDDQYGYKTQVTLQDGESLWHIAQRYNVTTTELIRWNNIKDSKRLRPGVRLTVWLPNNSNKQAKANSNTSDRSYQVQNGDSLWTIAKENNISTQQLARYNNISANDYLQPGQTINIP